MRCPFLLFVLFKKYLLDNGVDKEHIIEIALDGIENEELRDPKKCYQHIKDAMKDDQKYLCFWTKYSLCHDLRK